MLAFEFCQVNLKIFKKIFDMGVLEHGYTRRITTSIVNYVKVHAYL